MSTRVQHRRPAGTPVGGQFACLERPTATSVLPARSIDASEAWFGQEPVEVGAGTRERERAITHFTAEAEAAGHDLIEAEARLDESRREVVGLELEHLAQLVLDVDPQASRVELVTDSDGGVRVSQVFDGDG
ncbi:hypothetical protein U6M47_12890, partial [Cutibacterium acnes]